MRSSIIIAITMLAFASVAFAQIAQPTPPTPPTVAAPAMTQGGASDAAAPTSTGAQLQNFLNSPKMQKLLQQATAMSTIMSCAEKKVGKPAVQAFMTKEQQTGKTVQDDCNQGNTSAARSLVLSEITAEHNDPTAQAMIQCYDSEKETIQAGASPKMLTDMGNYSRWIRDPQLAEREMTDADVCHPKKPKPDMQNSAIPLGN